MCTTSKPSREGCTRKKKRILMDDDTNKQNKNKNNKHTDILFSSLTLFNI